MGRESLIVPQAENSHTGGTCDYHEHAIFCPSRSVS